MDALEVLNQLKASVAGGRRVGLADESVADVDRDRELRPGTSREGDLSGPDADP
jgi:hypothetical protein